MFKLMFKFILNFIPGVGPFVSAIGGFVAKNWKLVMLAALIGTIAYQNLSATRFVLGAQTIPYLEQQLVAKQTEIAELKNTLQVAVEANDNLTKAIETTNATIKEWVDISNATDTQVTDILNADTPKTCEASIQYLRDMKQKLTW
jgi:regulator of replication initiation timing